MLSCLHRDPPADSEVDQTSTSGVEVQSMDVCSGAGGGIAGDRQVGADATDGSI